VGAIFPLAVTLAIQGITFMALLTVPAMAPAVSKALGVSTAYTGAYLGLGYVGAMVSSLAGGAAIARWGAIRTSQAGLLICAAGLALSCAGSLWALAAGAVLIGLGYGPIAPAGSHLLVRTTPPGRMSLVFSIKQTGLPLGGMVAGAAVPGMAAAFGWQSPLLALAVCNLFAAVLVQPLRAEMDADRSAAAPLSPGQLLLPLRFVLERPALARLTAISFFFSAVQNSTTAYLAVYFTEVMHYTPVAAGLMLSAAQVGGLGGRVAWGHLSDSPLGPRRVLAALATAILVLLFALALLPAGTAVWAALLLVLLVGACAVGWSGIVVGEVARLAPPGTAGMATGGAMALTFIAVITGPPAFGAVSAAAGSYRAGFVLLALPMAACWWLLARGRREEASVAGTSRR
jgi:predicted MFS family arabinose efflux permease